MVSIQKYKELTFFDTKMIWSPKGDMIFGVYHKEGEDIKYNGKDIIHTHLVLYVIYHLE